MQKTPEIIFDCCVLSNFAFSDSLFILKTIYSHSAYVTEFVSAEIMRGIQRGYKDLERIQDSKRKGWLQEIVMRSPKERSLYETLSISLGLGESSSIAVAKIRELIFACDDKAARREAKFLEVKLTGTIGILKKAIQDKIIKLKDGDFFLSKMKDHGFYVALDSLKEI